MISQEFSMGKNQSSYARDDKKELRVEFTWHCEIC
jgi:hypothetical protein